MRKSSKWLLSRIAAEKTMGVAASAVTDLKTFCSFVCEMRSQEEAFNEADAAAVGVGLGLLGAVEECAKCLRDVLPQLMQRGAGFTTPIPTAITEEYALAYFGAVERAFTDDLAGEAGGGGPGGGGGVDGAVSGA